MTYFYSEDISSNPAVMHVVKSIISIPGVFVFDKGKSIEMLARTIEKVRATYGRALIFLGAGMSHRTSRPKLETVSEAFAKN
jgi:hypothetical protein